MDRRGILWTHSSASTIAKVSASLVPFLIVCYFVAYLDRVNVGFAALTMNKDLGLSASMCGFGAGVFFLAYFLFEVPSNLFLERFGARKWIARIMFSWGILSGATAFIRGDRASMPSRTARHCRSRLLSRHHLLSHPLVSRCLSRAHHRLLHGRNSVLHGHRRADPGLLLDMHGLCARKGWQWLFLIEALPALLLSVVVFLYLTDRPSDATWLEPTSERGWWRPQQERGHSGDGRLFSVAGSAAEPKV